MANYEGADKDRVLDQAYQEQVQVNQAFKQQLGVQLLTLCLLYTSPSPRDRG